MTDGFRIDEKTAKKISELLNRVKTTGSDRGPHRERASALLLMNDFTETIPAFSVLQPVDVHWEQDAAPIIKVTQYDGTYDGEFLFSDAYPIEVGEVGPGQSGRVVRCLFADGDGSVGTKYDPKPDSWDMQVGEGYVMACGETGNDGEMMAIVRGGGSGGCPTEVPDIISAEDADYVQVIRMVDGVPTCVVCELQPVICSSVSPTSPTSSASG